MSPTNNLADLRSFTAAVNAWPELRFEVSSRRIQPRFDPLDYLKTYFIFLPVERVESLFGNVVYPSRLYGGRPYELEHSLTDAQLERLEACGIHLTLTLTGHYFDEAVYRANRPLLRRHHKPGNAIVCTNDELARRLRDDFPDYLLKASLIKHLTTTERVEQALTLYDRAVIPMDRNDDDRFLQSLPDKDRIILFGNANCAYNCPTRTCYVGVSQLHWDKGKTHGCSASKIPRPDEGHVYFDIGKLAEMGFHHFKLVPHATPQAEVMVERLVERRLARKPVIRTHDSAGWENALVIRSFQKCGRTWLRFLLAHYLNLHFELNIPVNLQSVFTLLPNEAGDLKGPGQFQFSHVDDLPRTLWSHHLARADDSHRNRPWVLLLRSLPDVVVSDYFQSTHREGGFRGPLEAYVRAEKGALSGYCRFLNDWTADGVRRPERILTYEGLHRDAGKILKALLHVLDIEPNDSAVDEAVSLSTFDQMRRSENAMGIAAHYIEGPEGQGRRVREGRVGGYREKMDASTLTYLREKCYRLLSNDALALARVHGVLPWENNEEETRSSA